MNDPTHRRKPIPRRARRYAAITERQRAAEITRRYNAQLAEVIGIEHALSASLDPIQIYEILRDGVLHLFDDIAALYISSFDAQRGLIKAMYVFQDGEEKDVSGLPELPLAPPGQGTQSRVIHTRQPLVIATDLKKKLRPETVVRISGTGEDRDAQSVVYVPMLAQDDVLGIIQLQSYTPNRFSEADVRALTLVANTAAVSIQNARLLVTAQREIAERKLAETLARASEEKYRRLNRTLEERVRQRTAEMQRANLEMEHAVRLKDEFLANMSHELRTPLHGILSLAEILQAGYRGPLNEDQQRYVYLIETSGQHLLALINDLLDISKIEAGKLEIYPETVSIADVYRSSLAFVSEQAAKKNIRLEFVPEPALPTLEADQLRLKQILVNLLSNAVKFTPPGGRVVLEVHANLARRCVEFSVIDNGIGIAPADLSRLFTPFIQLDGSLNRQHEGTGLGLTLVKRLAEMHGGSVAVKSQVGQGSRFTVALPWQPTPTQAQIYNPLVPPYRPAGTTTEAAGEPSPAPLPPAGAEPAPPAGLPLPERGIILLAEDQPVSALALVSYLEDQGYQVVTAIDGVEALALAEAVQPDVILMDIQLPHIDGLEAIRRLRANPRFAATPIIALTALAMPGDRERCLAAGANEYLSKPVSLEHVVELITGFSSAAPDA